MKQASLINNGIRSSQKSVITMTTFYRGKIIVYCENNITQIESLR